MIRGVAVLRPEPGNAATCARAIALGLQATALPLFEVVALPWIPPDPADHDALLLTSANAARMAGAGLTAFASLPLLAVGEATAAAALQVGLDAAIIGSRDAGALLEQAGNHGYQRLLHLGGRETTIAVAGIIRRSIAVYASIATPVESASLAALTGSAVLLHSARAAVRLATLIDHAGIDRGAVSIVALSPAVGHAAGTGWATVAVATAPTDAALLEAARALAD